MSRLHQKVQFARQKGLHVFNYKKLRQRRIRGYVRQHFNHVYIVLGDDRKGDWAVLAENRWYPIVGLSYREAVALAYRHAIRGNYNKRLEN